MAKHSIWGHLYRLFALLGRTCLDMIYPPLCAVCTRRLVTSEEGICTFCAEQLIPYHSERWHAEERLWSVPAFRNLYSLYIYTKGQAIQTAIHAYKYHSYASFARMLSKRALLTLPLQEQGYDLIIVVPTTYNNELKRGYNQALIFAQGIARGLGIEASDKYILRREQTQSQTALYKWARHENVLERFYPNKHKMTDLSQRHILLVDDVLTTGSTLTAMLEILEQAGAKEIDVLTATVAV